jgi:hypothetical protein
MALAERAKNNLLPADRQIDTLLGTVPKTSRLPQSPEFLLEKVVVATDL